MIKTVQFKENGGFTVNYELVNVNGNYKIIVSKNRGEEVAETMIIEKKNDAVYLLCLLASMKVTPVHVKDIIKDLI